MIENMNRTDQNNTTQIPNYNTHSKFWLDTETSSKFDSYVREAILSRRSDINSVKLVDIIDKIKILKTIQNFVSIVTSNNSIPVEFHGESSHTNGNVVTISADVSDFDYLCGVSLHEASHIKHSNTIFNVFKTVFKQINTVVRYDLDYIRRPHAILRNLISIYNEVYQPDNLNSPDSRLIKMFEYYKDLVNICEDYRIDNLVVSNYPGYKGYYDSMNSHFLYNNNSLKDRMNSDEMKQETFISYKINILVYVYGGKQFSNLGSLKAGKEIIEILENKKTYKSALSVLKASMQMLEIIFKTAKSNNKNKEKNSSNGDSSNEFDNKDSGFSNDLNPDNNDNNNSSDNNNDIDDVSQNQQNNYSDNNDTSSDTTDQTNKNRIGDEFNELSNSSYTDVEDILKRVKNIFKKESISINQQYYINLFKNKYISVKAIKYTGFKDGNINSAFETTIDTVFVKELNNSTMKFLNDDFKINSRASSYETHMHSIILDGIHKGKILGKKLLVANDVHISHTIRKKHGKINSNLLAEAGFGNNKIFETIKVTETPSQFIHISIDNSSSMRNCGKFESAIQLAATIVSAAKYIKGIRVQVSMRYTSVLQNFSAGGTDESIPVFIIIYDSKYNNISHLLKWWPHIKPDGYTPEGICYEAILNEMIETSKGYNNKYLINISDGEPYFVIKLDNFDSAKYNHITGALEHTNKVMNKYRKNGFSIISYFVNKLTSSTELENFAKMYGTNDSHYVKPDQLDKIAKTINDKIKKSISTKTTYRF